ncbi:hypothetical protein ACJMK2_040267 [Sinanodonta woodiana]|uniref:Uncharacterized protein n=1 Tax=Sinanodonta woodiana TaxID=1069815 RepID=A0ABD3WG36_SINWO
MSKMVDTEHVRSFVVQTEEILTVDSDTEFEELDEMDRSSIQTRLYIINRSGSGEAHYILLSPDRSNILSYQVRTDYWRAIKDIAHFGVVVLDNKLYIIGGYDTVKCKHLKRLLRYDPRERLWTELSPMPKSKAKFGCSALDGKIYVCGGERSDGRASSSVEMFDPESNEWRSAGTLPAPRLNNTCAVYKREMYCAGGDYGTQSHDNFWVYEGGNFEELDLDYPHALPSCLDRFCATTLGNKIFFFGGVSCKVGGTNESNKFSTERKMFSYASNVSALSRQKSEINGIQSDMISPWYYKYPSLAHARHSAGVCPIGSRIYLFGGSHIDSGQDIRIVEFYDIERNVWEEDFTFRKGDVSNVSCAILEVPRRHDLKKINLHLKWVMW